MSAYFGLDIGSTSIKIIKSDEKKISTVSLVSNPTGKGLMKMSNSEKIALADSIRDMINTAGLKGARVVASLPESLVYSRVMRFPVMSSPELATAIKWELDQSVPFPPNEVETSWVVLEKPEKFVGDEKISVYVVAVPSSVSEAYVQLIEVLGLEPVRLENEVMALMRGFGSALDNNNPSIIVDFGASGTGMVLVGKSKIFGNYYLPYGGNVMTKLVADNFNLSLSQAESYKRTYGMAGDQLEGRMCSILKPVIDNFVDEVKKMTMTYLNDYKESSVDRLIVTGGGAYLRGVIPYLTKSLEGMEIVMGDPFLGLYVDPKFSSLKPVFAISCGLSMND